MSVRGTAGGLVLLYWAAAARAASAGVRAAEREALLRLEGGVAAVSCLESLGLQIKVCLRLRLGSCNLKVTASKCFINTICYSLEAMLIWFFTCKMENILYL